jgi:hypothetical protein
MAIVEMVMALETSAAHGHDQNARSHISTREEF